MKKINFTSLRTAGLALLLSVGAVLTSCSSSDSTPNNIIDDDSVVKTDDQAYSLAQGALDYYYQKAFGLSFVVEIFTSKTLSFEGEESEPGPLVSRLEVDESNYYIERQWQRNTLAIAAANNAIEQIEASKSSTLTANAKKVAIARAKLARALAYRALVRLYGEVPLNTSTTNTTKTRASIDDVYTQIVKDLEEAAEGLPSTTATSLPSEPTKEAAYALLSAVYLDWGNNPLSQSQLAAIWSQTDTDPAVSYNTSRLEKAVEYANKVTGYSLNSDFRTIWGNANEANKDEKILTFVHDGDAYGTGNHQTHCSFTFGFEREEENHLSPTSEEQYLNWPADDSRRDVSYIAYLRNPEDATTDTLVAFLPPYTVPRYGKFVDQTTVGPNNTYKLNDIDRIEIRYAEVLLVKAEALVELGRNAEAAEPLNRLRRRAFGDTSHDISNPTLDDVKAEWGYEFVYEQKEWFNLVRWKDLLKDLKSVANLEYFDESYKTAGAIGRNGYPVSSTFAKHYKHLHAKYDHRANKWYRFPIPLDLETGANLGITPQNPGY